MLKYVGAGFLPGVPARNLTDEEVEKYGGAEALLKSGLYTEAEEEIEEGELWQDQEHYESSK